MTLKTLSYKYKYKNFSIMENNNFSAGSKLIVDFFSFQFEILTPWQNFYQGIFKNQHLMRQKRRLFCLSQVKDNSNKREEAWKRIRLVL